MWQAEGMRKLLRAAIAAVVLLAIIGVFLLTIGWNTNLELPSPMASFLKAGIRKQTGAQLEYESLKISGSEGRGAVSKAVLKNASSAVFLTVREAYLHLASGTTFLDVLKNDAAVQQVEARDIDIDLDHLRLPEKQSPVDELPTVVPVNRFNIRNARVHTMIGTFTIDAADLDIRRVSGEYCGQVNVAHHPLGGQASMSFRIPFDLGTGSISIDWNGANLPALSSLYPVLWFWGISVDSGSATISLRWSGNLRERLEWPHSRIDRLFKSELEGRLQISDLAVTRDHLTTRWNGTIRTETDAHGTWNCSVEGALGQDFLRVESVFDGSGENWGIGASGTANLSTDTWRLIKGFKPLPADIEPGDARILFRARRPAGKTWQGEASGSLEGFLVDGITVESTRFSLRTEGRNIRYTAAIRSAAGQCDAEGEFDPDTHLAAADLSLQGVRSERIRYIPDNIKGFISGSLHLTGNPALPSEACVAGSIIIDRPCISGRTAERLEGNISWDRGSWSVRDPIVCIASGQIALDGVVSDREIEGELRGVNIPSEFLGIDAEIVKGICNFRADLDGTPSKPRYTGELWADRVTLWDRPLSILRARLTGNRSFIAIDHLQAELSSGGSIAGYLNFDLNTGAMTASRFDLAQIALDQFSGHLPEEWRKLGPGGRFDAVLERIPAESGATVWNVSMSGRSIAIASASIDEIALNGIVHGHLLEKFDATARIRDGTIALKGHQLPADGYTGELRLHELDLNVLGTILNVPSPLRGVLTADGTILWNANSPTGALTVVVRDLGIGDRFLGNGGGEIVVDKNGVRMDKAAFDRLGLKLAGKVRFDGRNSYDITCLMDRTDLSALPAAYGFRSFQAGDLLVTGSGRVEGRVGEAKPDRIEANIQSLEITRGQDLIVANKPMQFIYQNGIVELRSFELKYRQGLFGIEGVWDPAGRTAMTLTGRDFSILALGNLLEIPDWAVSGSLSFDGGIVGSYPALRLDSNVDVKNLTFKNRVIPGITGNIGLTPDKLKLSYVTVRLNEMNIGLSGGIPLPGSEAPDSMDLSLDIASSALNDLPILLPEVFSNASGSIQASMRFTGCPKAPIVAGSMKFQADQLRLRGMPKPLRKVDIGITTQNGIIRIDPIRATMGRGVFEGGGEVDFQSGVGSVSAKLSGQKLDLSWNGIDISGASATIDLGGTMYRPVVRGKIRIPKGRAQVGEFKTVSDFKLRLPLESLDYRFDVEIPRNFWVKNSFINAEMRGAFSAFGDLDKFHLDGMIQSVQGWLFFQRRKFQLENGEIRFGEQDEKINPYLFIKSVTNVQNTQIYLTLDGTVSSLTPRLHSSPPLAESDLVALLTLGRSMEEARKSDSKDLFEKEILEGLKNTYLSGLLGSTISTALNLDEVFFGSLFDRRTGITSSFLRVGKYIGKNIFIAYEGTLSNEGDKTYIFEYRLPKGFFINVEVEKPRNQTRIGVKYDWRF